MIAIKINLQGEIHGSTLIIDKQTSFEVCKVAIDKLLSLYYLAIIVLIIILHDLLGLFSK